MSANTRHSTANKALDQQLAHFLISPFRNTPLRPNHLTTLTLCLGLTAAWLFLAALEDLAWLAALIYMLAVFSDHLDGELARITGRTSSFGHDYDYIIGGINYMCLYVSIGIGLHASAGNWTLLLGLLAGLSNPLITFLRMKMEHDFGEKSVEHPRFGVFEIEDFIYLIGPITWLAGVIYFFVPYALGAIGYLLWTAWTYYRYQRDDDHLLPR